MATIENAFRISLYEIQRYAAVHGGRGIVVRCGEKMALVDLMPELMTVKSAGKTWSVPIVKYQCREGLVRSLMVKPCAHEGNCTALYLAAGELQCRQCAGLIHRSNSGHEKQRIEAKRCKLLQRLGLKPWQIPESRPARMWRRTYLAILNELAGLAR
ncbi:hypothetical protein [Actimicrobium antarcticum]|uniref:hypothetical protein n=1 Tax=Actimicrobium antarcticum TaxID=1051899 RepID=UPI0031DE2846